MIFAYVNDLFFSKYRLSVFIYLFFTLANKRNKRIPLSVTIIHKETYLYLGQIVNNIHN